MPLFGYRRARLLDLASAGASAVYAYGASRWLNTPSEFALFLLLTSYAMATASTLCGALLAENGRNFQRSSLFVGQQWLWFYVAIMLSAFTGRRPRRTSLAIGRTEGRRERRGGGADRRHPGHATPAEGAQEHREPPAVPQHASRHRRSAGSRKLWLVALFLFLYAFAPGFGTPLYYHMTDALDFSQAYIGVLGSDRLGGVDRRRPAASAAAAADEREDAAQSQHRAGNGLGRFVPAAHRRDASAALSTSPTAGHDDRHHRPADPRRAGLAPAGPRASPSPA